MSEVKRYDPMGYDRLSGYMQQHPEGDYVRHADYAALEAECERLRVSLKDADAGMMLFLEQRDALAAELAAIKGQELRADPVKAQLLEALEASNTLLRIKRHACGNTEVCRVLDTHITRNSAAIAAARKEGGE